MIQGALQHVRSNMKTTVFFDGSCPICLREINFYRRLSGSDRVDWLDLSDDTIILPKGIRLEAALSELHVQKPNGQIITGAAAFAAIWSELPYLRLFGRLAAVPPFIWLLDRLYAAFRKYRKPTPAQCGLRARLQP